MGARELRHDAAEARQGISWMTLRRSASPFFIPLDYHESYPRTSRFPSLAPGELPKLTYATVMHNPQLSPMLFPNKYLHCRSLVAGFRHLACLLCFVGFGGALFAKNIQMAIIPKLRAPWFNRLDEGAKKAAADFGVDTYMQAGASADEAEQVRLIQDAISRGVNALLIIPNNAQSLEPVLAQAKQQGIVVITHESPNQKSADFDIEMIDNEKFGQFGLEKMVQFMGPEGEYVIYVGSLTVPAHNIWADAAIKLAKEKYPKLKLDADRFRCRRIRTRRARKPWKSFAPTRM